MFTSSTACGLPPISGVCKYWSPTSWVGQCGSWKTGWDFHGFSIEAKLQVGDRWIIIMSIHEQHPCFTVSFSICFFSRLNCAGSFQPLFGGCCINQGTSGYPTVPISAPKVWRARFILKSSWPLAIPWSYLHHDVLFLYIETSQLSRTSRGWCIPLSAIPETTDCWWGSYTISKWLAIESPTNIHKFVKIRWQSLGSPWVFEAPNQVHHWARHAEARLGLAYAMHDTRAKSRLKAGVETSDGSWRNWLWLLVTRWWFLKPVWGHQLGDSYHDLIDNNGYIIVEDNNHQ